MSKAKPQIEWRNRIVSSGEQSANQFLAHEANARRHPAKQREALRGSLDELGWVAPVIVSKRSGKVLDGHARVEEALSKDENSTIPFVEVDVSESEEKLILASFDTVTLLAEYDREALDSLLQSVNSDNAAVQKMLSDLAAKEGVIPDDGFGTGFSLPDGDRAPFQQMTFTVSDAQAGMIKDALGKAKVQNNFTDTGNENSNGNALAAMAEDYLG